MERELVVLVLSRGGDSTHWNKNFNKSGVCVLDGNMRGNRPVSIFVKKGGVNPEVQDGSGCQCVMVHLCFTANIRDCTSME